VHTRPPPERPQGRSLRGRIFGAVALALALATALTVVVAGVVLRRVVEDRVLQGLALEADAVQDALSRSDTAALEEGLFNYLRRQGEFLGLPGLEGPAARLRDDLLRAAGDRTAGKAEVAPFGDVLFVVRQSLDGEVVLARKAGLGVDDWRPFLGILLLTGAAGALVATVPSYFLARRIARPLAEVGAASRRLAAGDATARVPVEGDDELAALGTSLNAMADGLQAARERERSFLLSVSQELKTPLTAVRRYAEAIRDGAVPGGEAAEAIAAEAKRLERLVHDLLDLARLDRREFALAPALVDLDAVAREAQRRHAHRAADLDVDLVAWAGPGAVAVADAGRVLQVVSNLVENALLATPSGGVVSIETGPGWVTVRDTGPGLEPGDLPRAFDRFYLYDRHDRERQVGTGLGMAIVKQLAEAMGGSVSVESVPGSGSAFTVLLPVGPAFGEAPVAPSPVPPAVEPPTPQETPAPAPPGAPPPF
jgi:signal transduction histidine kinase